MKKNPTYINTKLLQIHALPKLHAIPSYKKRSYKKRLVALEEVKKRKLVDYQRARRS